MKNFSLLFNSVLCGVLGFLFIISLLWGESTVHSVSALTDWLMGKPSIEGIIVGKLRLPRTLLAIMVGGTLGLSGAVLQGYLRNPLADPGLLGVSGGAALGAVCVFYTGLFQISALLLPLGGLIGAGLSAVLLLGLVGQGGVLVLIVAGTALSVFTTALTALVLNLVPSPYAMFEILHWLMGSLSDRTMTDVWLALPGVCLGGAIMASCGSALDALTMGEDVAVSLGFRLGGVFGVQRRVVLGVAVSVGSCVAVSGAIGFVGLMVPHMLRPFVGYRPSRLLLPSFLMGAVLLLGADLGVRMLAHRAEIQLGVITALLGVPVFFYRLLLYKQRTMF
ncbi:MAG: iron ABC transporter permease [Acetobacter sp.]|nr:iron ABC transporter permease [Acetobacter sp.]MBO6036452.1 iron ABC transporter permease [Acetobacter sp.]MBO6086168.1 iron ABC transporter permease [Acetobacter sp.]